MKNIDIKCICRVEKNWTHFILKHRFFSTFIRALALSSFFGGQFLNASINIGPMSDMGIDGLGNAIKVWEGNDTLGGGNQVIYVSIGSLVGVWSSPQNLSSINMNAYQPIVGVLINGDAIALWLEVDNANSCNILYSSVYTSGSWSTPTSISEITESVKFGSFRCSIDDSSNILVTWQSVNLQPVNDVYISMMRSVSSTLGQDWGTPTTIATL